MKGRGSEGEISEGRYLEVHAAWRNRWVYSEHCGGPGLFISRSEVHGAFILHLSYIDRGTTLSRLLLESAALGFQKNLNPRCCSWCSYAQKMPPESSEATPLRDPPTPPLMDKVPHHTNKGGEVHNVLTHARCCPSIKQRYFSYFQPARDRRH